MSSWPADSQVAGSSSQLRCAAWPAIVLCALYADSCFADCGPQGPLSALSPGGVYRLELHPLSPDRFELTLWRSDALAGPLAGGPVPIDVQGHHLAAFVADTGSHFVLLDQYEGLALYDAQGRRLAYFAGDDLLSWRERATRPGRRPCHPEGCWAQDSAPVSFTGGSVEVTTHVGRRIAIDLATGRIVRRDVDRVQAACIVAAAIAVVGISAFLSGRLSKFSRPGKRIRL